MQGSLEAYNSTIISTATTTVIKTGYGTLGGIFVSSSSSGTITIYDGTSAAGTAMVGIFTGVAGTFHRLPFGFGTGLTIVTGGTINCAVAWV